MNRRTRPWLCLLLALPLAVPAGRPARADEVILANDTRVQGTIRWEGALGAATESERLPIPLSSVSQVRIRGDRVLFMMEDGGWRECTLLTRDLTLDVDGAWHMVRADTIRSIRLTPRQETIVPAAGALPPAAALPPYPGPAAAAAPPPAAQPPGGPVPVERKPPAEPRKRLAASVRAGYATFLGNDADLLGGGAQYGFALGYELLQADPWFLGPEIAYLRSSHTGKASLLGVTQNVNSLGLGARGGFSLGRFDLYTRLGLGPVILDSGDGPRGKNATYFGFLFSLGCEYRIFPWLAVGPEMHLETIGDKSSTLSGLGTVTLRF